MATALLAFSALFTFLGTQALFTFDQTAAGASATPRQWPASSAIKRFDGHQELLVFVHPFCSCTVATIAELEQLSVRRKSPAPAPVITVLFFRPRNSTWAPDSLWRKAQGLESAHVLWDEDGREAKRFGARASGHVLLYNSEGALLFSGGVTGSRGHQGDNYGLDELAASLNSQRPGRASSRVYGCALGSLGETEDKL